MIICIHGQEFLEKCYNFWYIVIKVCTISSRQRSDGYFSEFEANKEREMERDSGLGTNLGSARHDAVTESAVQDASRRLKLRDVIGDRGIEKCDPNAPRIITSG